MLVRPHRFNVLVTDRIADGFEREQLTDRRSSKRSVGEGDDETPFVFSVYVRFKVRPYRPRLEGRTPQEMLGKLCAGG
jgi:hypothetical protein